MEHTQPLQVIINITPEFIRQQAAKMAVPEKQKAQKGNYAYPSRKLSVTARRHMAEGQRKRRAREAKAKLASST
jgi:hypothetical protein